MIICLNSDSALQYFTLLASGDKGEEGERIIFEV